MKLYLLLKIIRKKVLERFKSVSQTSKQMAFNLRQVSLNEVKSEILNLKIKSHPRATILKECVDIYLPFLTNAVKIFLDN